jgi:hypothetical protein
MSQNNNNNMSDSEKKKEDWMNTKWFIRSGGEKMCGANAGGLKSTVPSVTPAPNPSAFTNKPAPPAAAQPQL